MVVPERRMPQTNRFTGQAKGRGAGLGQPAGSTAAYRLAAAGARVVLLDRQRFPRDKPCGGGLTMRGVGLLPFDVSPGV